MDYEDGTDLTNATFKTITPEESRQFLVQETVFTLFCVVGICADAAIIYTVFCFKRLHTVPNIFLANWAIADLCSLIVTPSSYRVISVIESVSVSQEFICFLFHTDLIFHSTAMIFMVVLSLDWCLSAFFRRVLESFRNYYKISVGSIWVIALLLCSISTRLCIKRMYHFIPGYLLLFSYCTLLLFVVALQLFRCTQRVIKREHTNHPTLMLTLATIFVLNWLVGLLNFLVYELGGPDYHWLVTIFTQCVIFASAIINFILMYRFNNDFHACVRQALKRSDERYVNAICELRASDRSTNITCQNASGHELMQNA